MTIYAALADKTVAEVLAEHGGQGFGAFKPALGELLVEMLAPISQRFTELLADREALDAILARGAAKARQIAGPTLDAAYKSLGLQAAGRVGKGFLTQRREAVKGSNLRRSRFPDQGCG